MQLPIRIKIPNDPAAQYCMAKAGGRIVFPHNKPTMFHFDTNEQYNEYCKLLRASKK